MFIAPFGGWLDSELVDIKSRVDSVLDDVYSDQDLVKFKAYEIDDMIMSLQSTPGLDLHDVVSLLPHLKCMMSESPEISWS
jgi:hypothetical protein